MGGSRDWRKNQKKYTIEDMMGETGSGKGKNPNHFPVEANVRIKSKTPEGVLAEFRKTHLDEDHEFAYIADNQGYVHTYTEGAAHSVNIPNDAITKGSVIIHNHPSDTCLSGTDLFTFARTGASSVIASGKSADYILTKKGGHFDKKGFEEALRSATFKGADKSKAMDNWLRDNAGKYGLIYTKQSYNKDGKMTKIRKTSGTKVTTKKIG